MQTICECQATSCPVTASKYQVPILFLSYFFVSLRDLRDFVVK